MVYRLTGKPEYKGRITACADSLAMLYNPVVGTFFLAWNGEKRKTGPHTIIDNMMNLELLFWAAWNGEASIYMILRVNMRNDYETSIQRLFMLSC